ncbi:hypothetical protein QLH51_06935 [Sphingomonas sp. 2R-10]|uniref:hypothetical protein n=1 Tax=Sphingomonas sp. 2R-10 TaxID=3045148 RepID=UPI000F78125E|nr:hypothetical protein [Sphingomonas sp. 2R-10]MDJ0276526.1 hypothetical protein [Sphingomonas sp. 2R-10]
MIRAAVLLALVATLAGCGQPAADKAADKPRATPTPFVTGGWATVLGDAPRTIELLNGMGFRLSAYTPKGGAFVATAQPTPMGDPSVKPVNTANLTATGDAQRIGELRFTLDIVNLDSSPFAKDQFIRWVNRPLASMALPGQDVVEKAIRTESPASGTLPGADYKITREPIDGGRRLVVTFTRPAPSAGDSHPRNP